MSTTANRITFIVAALIGAAIWLLAIGLHIAGVFTGHTYELDHTVLLLGGIFGFVGFFGLDPKRAKEGGAFIVDSSVKIISALPRFGRRSTDAIAVPKAETTTTAMPTGATVPVVVGADLEKDEHVERPKFSPGGA